jgi:hypothetical protein
MIYEAYVYKVWSDIAIDPEALCCNQWLIHLNFLRIWKLSILPSAKGKYKCHHEVSSVNKYLLSCLFFYSYEWQILPI